MDQLWSDDFAEPVYVLTADQDWAPEWAIERFLAFAEANGLPLHVFVTNRSPALEAAHAASRVTLGAHPNFLPGSSHGSSAEEVIASCRSLVPEAKTFRTHAYVESAHSLGLLREAGFQTDSNLCLFLQPGIVPLIHATGVLRLPVFLDDDSLLLWDREGALELDPMAGAFAGPGLKILNFHPTLFAINCPSSEHYRARRESIYDPEAPPEGPFEGRGTADVLAELIARARDSGHRFSAFEEVADAAWGRLRSRDGAALYGWGPARPES